MEYSFLRIKNPNNKATKVDLGRVVFHLMDIIGFSEIDVSWYETGKQNQQHLHLIIKKKMPNEKQLEQMSKTFKTKKMRWYEYGDPPDEEDFGSILVHKMDTKQFTWELTQIEDKAHFNRIKYEYRFKEQKCDFVD